MLSTVGGTIFFIALYKKREITCWSTIKMLLAFLIGLLLLWMTAPSLKYMVTKDFDLVTGQCTIEIISSGRSASSTFHMLSAEEQFSFDGIPELDAYCKAIPYYCEVTVTKDRMWMTDYKIYDLKTEKLIDSYK